MGCRWLAGSARPPFWRCPTSARGRPVRLEPAGAAAKPSRAGAKLDSSVSVTLANSSSPGALVSKQERYATRVTASSTIYHQTTARERYNDVIENDTNPHAASEWKAVHPTPSPRRDKKIKLT